MEPRFRPTFVEIDLKALRENFRITKKRIPTNAKILGVVKANAYGCGATEVSNVLVKEGVNQLGVAILEEAISLRKAKISVPIVILAGIDQSQFSDVIRHKLTPVIWQPEMAKSFHNFLEKNDLNSPIFVKIDTGMHRLGINFEDFPKFAKLLSSLNRFHIECLMSHFSMSEDKDAELTKMQVEKFRDAINIAKEFNLKIKSVGISNSGGIINHLFEQNMENTILVRPGIMLYGSLPDPRLEKLIKLLPVMHFKTSILDIKRVGSGELIGYGGTYKAKQNITIAILPVGYADGYNRNLSNKADVLLKGKRAPVVGNISMDLTIIDISSIPDAKIGDEVVLIGSQGKEEITAWEIAKHLNTISYEVLTSVSARVPRIYKS